MPPDRHVPLEGASNFRDFGGYGTADGRWVRWGRLFRSDRLSELTEADFERLARLGIRHVYDLRRASEVDLAPTRWHRYGAPRLVPNPIFEDESGGASTFQRIAADEGARHDAEQSRAIMRNMYERMVTEAGPLAAFGALFASLAEPDHFPALFHCAGGKDRTGVVCALILLTLGVSREDVVADFMLTQRYYDSDARRAAHIAGVIASFEPGFFSDEALGPVFSVEPGYLETALEAVEADGGAEMFLAGRCGVDGSTFERLRETLLE
jgi:protein-tyrosine phosphatase